MMSYNEDKLSLAQLCTRRGWIGERKGWKIPTFSQIIVNVLYIMFQDLNVSSWTVILNCQSHGMDVFLQRLQLMFGVLGVIVEGFYVMQECFVSVLRFFFECRQIVEENTQLMGHKRQAIMQILKSISLALEMNGGFVFDFFLFVGPVPAFVLGGVGGMVVFVVGVWRRIHVVLFSGVDEVFMDFVGPFVVAAVPVHVLLVFLGDVVGYLVAIDEFVGYEGGHFEGVGDLC